MLTRSITRMFMVFCFFAFTITIGAIARPAFAQCDKVTDSQIVASIYAKIKNDKGLAPQISHLSCSEGGVACWSAVYPSKCFAGR
ncbi:MAG: hypothetical protein IPG58_14875 [Acidobacteria bacterium]|nr:hypothetical protein [Acidobacteriota bacterium]